MSNNTNRSTEDGSLWQDLFGNGGESWLLGIGAFLILINAVVFFGIETKPNAWRFYLDIRNWHAYLSIPLWVAAIWLISETTDIVEDYRLFIRIPSAICLLITIIFALWNSASFTSSATWFGMVVIAVCCAVRSFLLFRRYRHEGEGAIDMEEAKWFWGLSGLLCTGLILLGLMSLIPVEMKIHAGTDSVAAVSLLKVCHDGLQDWIRHGRGSFAMLVFSVLFFAAAIVFVYVVGKWMLIFMAKTTEEE